MEERLQKYMARCGVDSRRKCEELIAQGLVEVNGEVVREPGVKIDPMADSVKVNGKRLKTEKPVHYIHYKTKGVTTTVSDDLGRRTVMDCLPRQITARVYPVGRLDKESEGLLVLTNDGAMANYLTHPAHGVQKTYRVVAEGRVAEDVIATLAQKGMRLGPVLVKPSRVELVRYDNDNTVVLITVSEGINREVRRIFAALGHEVKKLLRTQVGPLSLAGLKRGGTRILTAKELAAIRKGMEGIDEAAEEALFPAGSASARKPKGPRGRPTRAKAPRHGKPDPAAAAPRPASRIKGKVVDDDWQKRTGPKKTGPKAKAVAADRPIRVKTKASAAASGKKPAGRAKPPAKAKPRQARHPLAPPPAPRQGKRGAK